MAKIPDDAFVEEVRTIKKTAFGVAYLILKNTTDCEDAMSAAIVKAYAHREKLNKRSSFRAWFLRILRNEAYDILRERRKVFETDEIPETPSPFPDTASSLDLRAALMRIIFIKRKNKFYKKNVRRRIRAYNRGGRKDPKSSKYILLNKNITIY